MTLNNPPSVGAPQASTPSTSAVPLTKLARRPPFARTSAYTSTRDPLSDASSAKRFYAAMDPTLLSSSISRKRGPYDHGSSTNSRPSKISKIHTTSLNKFDSFIAKMDSSTGRRIHPTLGPQASEQLPAPSGKPKTEEYVDHPEMRDPKADLAIRSNDGMVFKVHQYDLDRKCNLIKDTSSLSFATASDGIHTMDIDFNRDTIELFIELARSIRAPSAPPKLSNEAATSLIDIATFFDCPHVIHIAKEALCQSVGPFELLNMAAEKKDDEYFIRQALDRRYRETRLVSHLDKDRAQLFSRGLSDLPPKYAKYLLSRMIPECVTSKHFWGWMNCDAEVNQFVRHVKGVQTGGKVNVTCIRRFGYIGDWCLLHWRALSQRA